MDSTQGICFEVSDEGLLKSFLAGEDTTHPIGSR